MIHNLVALGIETSAGALEIRRIKLTNAFTLICLLLILLFSAVNLIVGDYAHALRILAGIFVLVLPVLLLNYYQRFKTARTYLIASIIIFVNFVSYTSILQSEMRLNEVLLIGISALVVVLYDGYSKIAAFVLVMFSALVMHLIRWQILYGFYNVDLVLALVNLLASFLCVYFFTSLYRNELEKSLEQSTAYSAELISKNHEIEQSRFVLRSLINNIPIFLAMIDSDGNYLLVNSRYKEAFEKDVDQIEGRNSSEFLSKSMHELHQSFIKKALSGDEPEFNRTIRLNNGRNMHLYGKMIALTDAQNKQVLIEFGSDVTKLKDIESELVKLNDTKDKLIGIISHDLKSPIHTLKSIIQVSDSLGPKELVQLINKIQGRVDIVADTLDNVLGWVQTQMKGFKAELQKVNINDCIQDCILLYKPSLTFKSIIINNHVLQDEHLTADPNHLLLVIRNLLSNAIKFTPPNGTINISYKRSNGEATLSIEDSGAGMDKTQIDNLLKGKRITSTRGTSGELGTGLGIGLCIDILKQNNAKLQIESVPNKGTCMKVIFKC